MISKLLKNKNDEEHDKRLAEIEENINLFGAAIRTAKAEHEELKKTKVRLQEENRMLIDMITAAGGYIWEKDANGIYRFCDPQFCWDFFGLEPVDGICDIAGTDDVSLLNAYRQRTGKQHSFGELCVSSDHHCLAQGKRCLYVEFGYIDQMLFVLHVIKTPLYCPDGKPNGTVGFAWNRSHEAEFVLQEVERCLENGYAKRLTQKCKNIAVYWVEREKFFGPVCNIDIKFPR